MPMRRWNSGSKEWCISRKLFFGSLSGWIAAGIILGGCEKQPVYGSFCGGKASLPLPCITIDVIDPVLSGALHHDFSSLENEACSYSLKGYRYHLDACRNPDVKSRGGDFNGYIRLWVEEKGQCIYKAQSDFKFDEEAAVKRVSRSMKKTLFENGN